MRFHLFLASIGLPILVRGATPTAPGVASYIAPAGFPTSAFSSYYFLPASPTQEPQPAIYDPVLKITYPSNLTNPNTIPTEDDDPVLYPVPVQVLTPSAGKAYLEEVITNVTAIIKSTSYSSNCTKCQDALFAGQKAAKYTPTLVPQAMIELCISFKFANNATCEESYTATTFGAVWTQVLAFADLKGSDGQYICNFLSSTWCPKPKTLPLDTKSLFPKPKPANPKVPKPSGKRIKVLHLSDFHLDARYSTNSEANCTSGLCCRNNNVNKAAAKGQVLLPAPYYGAFACDTPYSLGLAALQAVGPLTGTSKTGESFGFSIYTGDLVAHDPQSSLSRAYTTYTETSVYGMFKSYITGPIFAALGNHDSNPENIDAPHSLPGPLGEQQSWNFNHVADLWQHEGWITPAAAQQARTHYGGYSIKTHYPGLRIIAFNTDFWYRTNYFNYINTTNPDNSGIFAWMIKELQAAEDCGDRVWLVGHVISGWDGTNPLPNPTNLFYQIVARYSPHVIANIFFGHTHEDHIMLYYANNGTQQSAAAALATAWIGPSVTPLTNLNSGFRSYAVDTGDWNIYDAYTFYSNVSTYGGLATGPTFALEYSTREAYGAAAGWPDGAPLNATFWHRVTEAMEKNHTLVSVQNAYQGKLSSKSPACVTADCANARICYMRSGSVALGSACKQGYGSVQSAFKPT